MDQLPFPARHLVDKYDYGYLLGIKLTNGKTTSIITTRGCPHHCSFCGIRVYDPFYLERSVDNVINEIEEIIKQGYQSIITVDNSFLANKKRVEKIMEIIIKNDLKIDIWILGARVDSTDKKLYEKMRKAGVKFISFGIESGNQDVLDFYNKNITLKQIKKAISLSKKMGFTTMGTFIFGAPFETENHIEKTIKFAKSLPLDIAEFSTLGYCRGSSLWQKAYKEGKIQQNEYYVDADSERGLGNLTNKKYDTYCMQAHRRFYYDPRYITKQLINSIYSGDFRLIKAGLKMFTLKDI